MNFGSVAARVLAAMPFAVCPGMHAASASELWHSDWVVQAPPRFWAFAQPSPSVDKPRTTFGFSSTGDVIVVTTGSIGGEFRFGYQMTSIAPAGDLRWTASLADQYPSAEGAYAIQPDALGGAFLAFGFDSAGDYENQLIHVDATGNTVWSRNLATGWLAMQAANRLGSLGCGSLTVLDTGDGHVLWEHVMSSIPVGQCDGGLAADAGGNLFAATDGAYQGGGSVSGFRLVKFDAQGQPLWDITTPTAFLQAVIGASDSQVYIRTRTDVRALRSIDGSLAWTIPLADMAKVFSTGGGSPEVVIVDAASVQRIDGDTGQPRWSEPPSGIPSVAGIAGDSLVVATSSGTDRIGLASGAIEWHVAGPAFDWLGFGGPSGSSFVGIARDTNGQYTSSPKRVALDDGSVSAIALPAIPIGTDASSVVDDAGGVVSAAMIQRPDQVELRVRRIASDSGTTIWDLGHLLGNCCVADWSLLPPTIATRSDAIAVAFATPTSCTSQWSSGFSAVSLIERADGSERWRSFLIDDGEGCVQASTPAIDENGDVYQTVGSVVRTISQGAPFDRGRQTLYKLDGQTGAVLWRVDQDVQADYYLTQAQIFSLIGSDVLLQAPFTGSQDTIRRISGVDGSTVWSSDIFSGRGIGFLQNGVGEPPHPIDANHVAVFSGTSSEVDWAAIDTDTGEIAWTFVAPVPACVPVSSCAQWYSGLTSRLNGDAVLAGEYEYSPLITRYRTDGSGIADRWVPGSGNSSIIEAVAELWPDSGNGLELNLYRGFRASQGSLRFLSTFDYTSGELGGKQAIYEFSPNGAAPYPTPLAAPAAERLLASTFGALHSGPATSGATLFDTQVTAHGNLSVTLTSDRIHVQAGQTVGFHLMATYTGDAPLVGVKLSAVMPWQGGISSAVCSGASCVLDTTGGDLVATFDVAPGNTIDITGQVRVLDQIAHPAMSAHIWGPLGLSEDDIVDNFAQVTPQQSLFANGFDP